MVKKRLLLLLNLTLFVFILIYFTQISPLVPFDGDDWRYIGGIRLPFPMWGVWNPTKVLPETLMAVGGYIAAFVILPFSGDYINSLVFTEATIFSLFIMAFLLTYYKLLTNRFRYGRNISLASELTFFVSFFLLFKHLNYPSYSGFWTVDLTCVFNYLIPNLLNASMVMYMERFDNFYLEFKTMSNIKKGIFILCLYFTLFSSTQATIIIATYSFFKIIQIFVQERWKLTLDYLKKVSPYLVILFIWIVTVIFDLNGQRSKSVQGANRGTFADEISATLRQFNSFLKIQNTKVVYAFGVVIVFAIICCIVIAKHNTNNSNLFISSLLNSIFGIVVASMYLVIAYSKAGSQYAARPDAMWPIIFFFLFATNISFIYLINNFSFLKPFLPIFIVLISLISFSFNYQQVPATNAPYSAKTAKRVDNYIISQIIRADEEGKSKVVVKVPLDSTDANPRVSASNWPHSYDMAIWLQNTLYSHKIIRTRFKIEFKPDNSVNKRFYESRNQQPFAPLE